MMSCKWTTLAIAAAGLAFSACQGTSGNCVEDKDCPNGEACVSGSCQASAYASCRTSADCPTGDFCPAGACLPDCTQLGCSDGQSCNASSHLCDAIVEVVAGPGGGNGRTSSSGSSSNATYGGSTSSSGGASSFCGSCASNADCGGGNNFCLTDSSGNDYCGVDCSSGQACPSAATCQPILNQNGNPVGSNCVPTSGSCADLGTGSSSSSGGSSSSSSSSAGGSSSSGSSSSTAAQCTPDTWSNFAQGFFTTNCTSCHSQFATYSSVVSDASSISSKISSGSMPLLGSLSASDKSRILLWLSCGEPQ